MRAERPQTAASRIHAPTLSDANDWREVILGMVPGLSVDWVNRLPQATRVAFGEFAGTGVMEMGSDQPIRVERQCPPGSETDGCNLVLQLEGDGLCRHAGREAEWACADLVLFDNHRPFDVIHPDAYRVMMWRLPQEALGPMLAEPDRAVGVRIPGGSGPGAILRTFVGSLVSEGWRSEPVVQRGLLTHLCGLVGLAVGGSALARESRGEAHRAARRQQILGYVRAHLRDPRLSVHRAADALRISPRWLHALLEDGGQSFSRLVTDRRLEECRSMLEDPAYDGLSIADVAFHWGFNDLSTFNRRFRAKYGMAPRDTRRQR